MKRGVWSLSALAIATLSANAELDSHNSREAKYACGDDSVTLISTIQGSGSQSFMIGNKVAIEAIVIADLQDKSQLKGFFVQEESHDEDNDAHSSEGLFVYSTKVDVNVGDQVLVVGTVDEYYNLTQLNQVEQLEVCASHQPLPPASEYSLPLTSQHQLEAVEGMRIQFNDTLTVNEVYNLGRYGEFTVSNGRRFIATEIATPGEDALSVMAANELNQLLVDDGFRAQNPASVIFPAPELDAYNTLRVGERLNQLTGVVNYNYGNYKLIPTETPVFNGDHPRTLAPEPAPENTGKSQLRIASFNVLNYFNGDGLGGGFPTARGASNTEELERQQAKLVSAITAIDADVIGLMELENDGYSHTSAIATLVDALNTQQKSGSEYVFVHPDVDTLGDDAIAVGMIYRPASVALINPAKILNSETSPLDADGHPLFVDTLNRPALAQSIRDLQSDEVITIVVNHFKSKGSGDCESHNDCDQGDGQGAYNHTRTKAAQAMSLWLENAPTGVQTDNILIMGDINAYSKEDPIRTFAEAGYATLKKAGDYSYVYYGQSGNLDHALASDALAQKVSQTQDWHINTDEPKVLDYNTEYKTDAQILNYYADHAYRSSDHDPVIVDLAFDTNQAPGADFKAHRFLFWWLFVSKSSDADGNIASEHWKIGGLEFTRPWALISNRYLRRNQITEATLTVSDNEGSKTAVTKTFR